jgi:hypothetical protein
VGFTGHDLVCMLKGGMSLETLSDLIEVRMTYCTPGPRRLSRLEMKRFPLYLRIQSARGQFTSAALHSRSSPAEHHDERSKRYAAEALPRDRGQSGIAGRINARAVKRERTRTFGHSDVCCRSHSRRARHRCERRI